MGIEDKTVGILEQFGVLSTWIIATKLRIETRQALSIMRRLEKSGRVKVKQHSGNSISWEVVR